MLREVSQCSNEHMPFHYDGFVFEGIFPPLKLLLASKSLIPSWWVAFKGCGFDWVGIGWRISHENGNGYVIFENGERGSRVRKWGILGEENGF